MQSDSSPQLKHSWEADTPTDDNTVPSTIPTTSSETPNSEDYLVELVNVWSSCNLKIKREYAKAQTDHRRLSSHRKVYRRLARAAHEYQDAEEGSMDREFEASPHDGEDEDGLAAREGEGDSTNASDDTPVNLDAPGAEASNPPTKNANTPTSPNPTPLDSNNDLPPTLSSTIPLATAQRLRLRATHLLGPPSYLALARDELRCLTGKPPLFPSLLYPTLDAHSITGTADVIPSSAARTRASTSRNTDHGAVRKVPRRKCCSGGRGGAHGTKVVSGLGRGIRRAGLGLLLSCGGRQRGR
ncbi:uncharacterized protein HMPREF1541_09796 [Cyphellophora europaea CBS 101466]|uniref:Uncharacterized protein n=1 Tax=Cyphellophora europaea (strain CBS 101466) TaxID=1220924 RepID=W2S8A0_CYPE1|nr:uncharacterized protein HMPREF1541_09796 [Cyphellophora europaea CBS 101466]ETN44921.1 hypothetical protein HMPREF1541_09796 [Cyphellophora europaea CBS 101466]